MTKKNRKKKAKNASIITTISGLAGAGALKLIEWGSAALASGVYEPTAATFQGAGALLAAGIIFYFYANRGVTSLPFDDSEIKQLVNTLGERVNEIEDKHTDSE